MRQLFRRRPSPSLVVAIAAVVVAGTGSAVAATVITSKQIKDGTISLADLSKATRDALQGGRGPQGAVGPGGGAGGAAAKGDKGDKGDPGAPGTVDAANFYSKAQSDARYLRRTITVVASGTVTLGNFAGATAICPEGHEAVGGGVDPNGVKFVHVTASHPVFGSGSRLLNQADGQGPAATGWEAFVEITDTQGSAQFKVAAICAPVG